MGEMVGKYNEWAMAEQRVPAAASKATIAGSAATSTRSQYLHNPHAALPVYHVPCPKATSKAL